MKFRELAKTLENRFHSQHYPQLLGEWVVRRSAGHTVSQQSSPYRTVAMLRISLLPALLFNLACEACYTPPSPLPTPPPSTPLSELYPPSSLASLPPSFTWRDVDGVDLTSPVRSQFAPQWCVSHTSILPGHGKRLDRSRGWMRSHACVSLYSALQIKTLLTSLYPPRSPFLPPAGAALAGPTP